ncbi:hypothetical protein MXB_2633 [Myxobolus squamalis]|nr:hypothetical protein MXB_2633 [Myxobolus squamalis]
MTYKVSTQFSSVIPGLMVGNNKLSSEEIVDLVSKFYVKPIIGHLCLLGICFMHYLITIFSDMWGAYTISAKKYELMKSKILEIITKDDKIRGMLEDPEILNMLELKKLLLDKNLYSEEEDLEKQIKAMDESDL